MSVPSVPSSVGDLRRFALAAGRSEGFTGDTDTLALLVSVVATNALLHGRGQVSLRVTARAPRLRVEVTDASDVVPVRRPATELGEGGRGLMLLDLLSDRWGVERVPPRGKVVWFELLSVGA
jgi:anti-sigma regulatory factor (Ser/Thr protein kinase)